uniref:Putative tick transposon n=1 Tax=Ixodes ricinus TaxID=34613 RepID=A0A6B0UUJ3_IXORI
MTINSFKTQLVSFTRAHSPITSTCTICNQPVTKSPMYKYLDARLSSDLAWNTHLTHILSIANRSLGYIRCNLKLAPPSVQQLAHTTLVRSQLEYTSYIWPPWQHSLVTNIEAVQNGAIFSDYSRDTSITSLRINSNLDLFSSRRTLS